MLSPWELVTWSHLPQVGSEELEESWGAKYTRTARKIFLVAKKIYCGKLQHYAEGKGEFHVLRVQLVYPNVRITSENIRQKFSVSCLRCLGNTSKTQATNSSKVCAWKKPLYTEGTKPNQTKTKTTKPNQTNKTTNKQSHNPKQHNW